MFCSSLLAYIATYMNFRFPLPSKLLQDVCYVSLNFVKDASSSKLGYSVFIDETRRET